MEKAEGRNLHDTASPRHLQHRRFEFLAHFISSEPSARSEVII
jgi:hypothetical protein